MKISTISMIAIAAIASMIFAKFAIANISHRKIETSKYFYLPSANGEKISLTIVYKNKNFNNQTKGKILKSIDEIIGKENREKWINDQIEWVDYNKIDSRMPIVQLKNIKHHLQAFKDRKLIKCKEPFLNAQTLQKEYPGTFFAPTIQELNQIKVGSIVKVNLCTERFWTIIYKIEGNKIFAEVANPLYKFEDHGLSNGDKIVFMKENIYDIHSV